MSQVINEFVRIATCSHWKCIANDYVFLISKWQVSFSCTELYTDIPFHSQDEYQIRQYHQKEQLLEDKVIVIESATQ